MAFRSRPTNQWGRTLPEHYHTHEQPSLDAALQFAEHTLATTPAVYQEICFTFRWRHLYARAARRRYTLHFWLQLVFTPSRFHIFRSTDCPALDASPRRYLGGYQEEYNRLRFYEDALYPSHNNAICSKAGMCILLMKNWLPPTR